MLTLNELDILLNPWPPETVGAEKGRALILQLNALGEQYGYGILAQMAEFIKQVQLFSNPAGAAAFKRERSTLMGWLLPTGFEEVASKANR